MRKAIQQRCSDKLIKLKKTRELKENNTIKSAFLSTELKFDLQTFFSIFLQGFLECFSLKNHHQFEIILKPKN